MSAMPNSGVARFTTGMSINPDSTQPAASTTPR
jgi:hypothetical protein